MKRLLLAVIYVLGLQSAASATVLTIGQLEAEVNAAVNMNGNQAITGSILNGVLTDMTQSLSVVTLPVTVAGTVTSGGVPYFSSTIAMASSALLTANALVVGGGAGLPPATVTTGVGVLAALAITPGTAGAFVVNGGALGTPTSGVGTNITNVNAAMLGGATFAAPGPIGSGTPSTGAFTTISGTTVSDTNEEVNGGGHFYGAYSGSYPTTDGVVVDYVSPNGRLIVGASDNVCAYNAGPTSPTSLGCFTSAGLMAPATGYKLINLLGNTTAPTVTNSSAGGFCYGGTTATLVGTPNGTMAFTVTVGSGGGPTCTNTGTVNMPTATTGWACGVNNLTNVARFDRKTGGTNATIIITNTASSALQTPTSFTAGDVLEIQCTAY